MMVNMRFDLPFSDPSLSLLSNHNRRVNGASTLSSSIIDMLFFKLELCIRPGLNKSSLAIDIIPKQLFPLGLDSCSFLCLVAGKLSADKVTQHGKTVFLNPWHIRDKGTDTGQRPKNFGQNILVTSLSPSR